MILLIDCKAVIIKLRSTKEAIPQITGEDNIPRRAQADSTAFSIILGELKVVVDHCYPNPCQRGPFLLILVYSSNGASVFIPFSSVPFGKCAVPRREQLRLHIIRFHSSSNGNSTLSLLSAINSKN